MVKMLRNTEVGMNARTELKLIAKSEVNILRKTIEGYLDSAPSLTFNTIKTINLLCMHVIVPDICNQDE